MGGEHTEVENLPVAVRHRGNPVAAPTGWTVIRIRNSTRALLSDLIDRLTRQYGRGLLRDPPAGIADGLTPDAILNRLLGQHARHGHRQARQAARKKAKGSHALKSPASAYAADVTSPASERREKEKDPAGRQTIEEDHYRECEQATSYGSPAPAGEE